MNKISPTLSQRRLRRKSWKSLKRENSPKMEYKNSGIRSKQERDQENVSILEQQKVKFLKGQLNIMWKNAENNQKRKWIPDTKKPNTQ